MPSHNTPGSQIEDNRHDLRFSVICGYILSWSSLGGMHNQKYTNLRSSVKPAGLFGFSDFARKYKENPVGIGELKRCVLGIQFLR